MEAHPHLGAQAKLSLNRVEALPRPLLAVFGWYFRRVVRSDDTDRVVTRKIVAAMYMIGAILATIVVGLSQYLMGHRTGYEQRYLWIVGVLTMAPTLLVVMYVRRSVGVAFFSFILFWCIALAAWVDYTQMAMLETRAMPIFIAVLDMMIVGSLPTNHSLIILATILLWVALLETEMTVRWGLLDLWGLPSQEQRMEMLCSCAELPCPRPVGSTPINSLVPIFGLVMDFFITRGFARAMYREQAMMQSAIDAADQIAASLARFDLSSAETVLQEKGEVLPMRLIVGFHTLLKNLEKYRPYLPQSCLRVESSQHAEEPQQAESVMSSSLQGLSGDGSEGEADVLMNIEVLEIEGDTGVRPQFDLITDTLAPCKVALMHINACGAVSALDDFSQQHATFLTDALAHVHKYSGIVDTFLANRVIAAFYGPQPHFLASQAATAAKGFTQDFYARGTPFTCRGFVIKGLANVGTLGCSVLRRPVIMGKLTTTAYNFERVSQLCSEPWMCNSTAAQEMCRQLAVRVVLNRLIFDTEMVAWERPQPCSEGQHPAWHMSNVVYEFMIEGDAGLSDAHLEWDVYNEIGKDFLIGQNADAAIEAIDNSRAFEHQRDLFRRAVREAKTICLRSHVIA